MIFSRWLVAREPAVLMMSSSSVTADSFLADKSLYTHARSTNSSASRPKNMPPSQPFPPPQLASIQGRVCRQPNLHFRHGCLLSVTYTLPSVFILKHTYSIFFITALESSWGDCIVCLFDLCPLAVCLCFSALSLLWFQSLQGCALSLDVNGSFVFFSCVSRSAYIICLFALKHKSNYPVSICSRLFFFSAVSLCVVFVSHQLLLIQYLWGHSVEFSGCLTLKMKTPSATHTLVQLLVLSCDITAVMSWFVCY